MNRKQIQMAICKGLLDTNKRVGKCYINDNELAITTDGYCVFVFYKEELIVDKDKIPKIDTIKLICQDDENDEPIKVTNKQYCSGDKWLREYKGANITLYANKTIAAQFDGYNLFAHSPLNRIIAKDDIGRIVGAFMPMRFNPDEI